MRTTEMKEKSVYPNYKVEVKNINSFRFLEKAINYEIQRQTEALMNGEVLKQENRGFNESKGITVLQRKKEEAKDYRYFPDPDLPPMTFSDEYILDLKNSLPELPFAKYEKLKSEFGLNENQARFLTNGDGLDLYSRFIELASLVDAVKLANLLINKPEFRNLTNEEFVQKIKESENSNVSDERVIEVVKIILSRETDAVEKIKAGKESVMMFLVGQVMKELKAKVDTNKIIEVIKSQI
jgi:aspartyl-tRNA(Asn)/glutamyl-tRNA(Gln) amidotransferase subunit B